MKVIAAYLLAVLGGNTSPSAENLKDILGSVGAEVDDDKIELLLSEVKGKDITELIASGREKLASVPSGGGGAVAVAATGGGGGAAAAPAAAEAKKEEKVEEKEESDDVHMVYEVTTVIVSKHGLTSLNDFTNSLASAKWLSNGESSWFLLVHMVHEVTTIVVSKQGLTTSFASAKWLSNGVCCKVAKLLF
ncbi:hypothetical protein SO802_009469 [Lithocarpus litseifolius]|uniref:60S acidic ribosomal protein P2 n=1 Tax=Lithocarpus litseifolius TaxID=425828 RepID=A0AAW2DDM3_9ROSI